MRFRTWGALSVVCFFPALALPQRNELARPVAPGLEYEHRRLAGPLSVHILTVDPRHQEVFAARALNDGVGVETVSSIARRNRALAAINGGFFGSHGRYEGDPSGILRIGGRWFSDSSVSRGVIGWTGGGRRVQFGRVVTRWSVDFDETVLEIAGINRSRSTREVVLYTWDFHRSTLTYPEGFEIAVRNGTVLSVVEGGDTPIPEGGFVVSVGADVPGPAWRALEPGTPATVHVRYQGAPGVDWDEMDFAVGGTPVIVEEGRVVEDYSVEGVATDFVDKQHPRTAVGIRGDGTWVFVVVDGRRPELSVGLTMSELARFMVSLGCRNALNLDGGGSSTLYLDGRVVNSPADVSGERPVSDAILVRARKNLD